MGKQNWIRISRRDGKTKTLHQDSLLQQRVQITNGNLFLQINELHWSSCLLRWRMIACYFLLPNLTWIEILMSMLSHLYLLLLTAFSPDPPSWHFEHFFLPFVHLLVQCLESRFEHGHIVSERLLGLFRLCSTRTPPSLSNSYYFPWVAANWTVPMYFPCALFQLDISFEYFGIFSLDFVVMLRHFRRYRHGYKSIWLIII